MNAAVLLALGLLAADAPPQRIVFIGDSITDGHTYPLLVRQALAEAHRPVPVCINAGIAGDTAAGMQKRIERDVLPHRPTLVTLSVGINDVFRKITPADYEADVAAIAERLQKDKVPMLLFTTTILGPKHAEQEKRLEEYNAVLHRIADKHGFRIAEVNQRMQEARRQDDRLLEADDVHLSFAGYRVMARAVLDGLGHKNVAVPAELKVEPMPGIIRDWRVRAVADKEPALDDESLPHVKPDETWKQLTLPEKTPAPHWWNDQERRRGFAGALDKLAGQAKTYRGVATIEADKTRQVYFNTGGQLQTIWLNGKRIYRSAGWTGWHAGKERVAAELQAGKNVVIIETGPGFFLSITDDKDW